MRGRRFRNRVPKKERGRRPRGETRTGCERPAPSGRFLREPRRWPRRRKRPAFRPAASPPRPPILPGAARLSARRASRPDRRTRPLSRPGGEPLAARHVRQRVRAASPTSRFTRCAPSRSRRRAERERSRRPCARFPSRNARERLPSAASRRTCRRSGVARGTGRRRARLPVIDGAERTKRTPSAISSGAAAQQRAQGPAPESSIPHYEGLRTGGSRSAPHPADRAAQHMRRPGQEPRRAHDPARTSAPPVVAPADGRDTRACAPTPRTRQPPASPATQPAARQLRRRRFARRRCRRPRSTTGDARRRLQTLDRSLRRALRRRNRLRKAPRTPRAIPRRRRQRTPPRSSADAFRQPARCRRPSPSRNPNVAHARPRCGRRRPRSPATPASARNRPGGFAEPRFRISMPGAVANRPAGVQQNLYGAQAARRRCQVSAADAGNWKTAASGQRALDRGWFRVRRSAREGCIAFRAYVSWREFSRDETE